MDFISWTTAEIEVRIGRTAIYNLPVILVSRQYRVAWALERDNGHALRAAMRIVDNKYFL